MVPVEGVGRDLDELQVTECQQLRVGEQRVRGQQPHSLQAGAVGQQVVNCLDILPTVPHLPDQNTVVDCITLRHLETDEARVSCEEPGQALASRPRPLLAQLQLAAARPVVVVEVVVVLLPAGWAGRLQQVAVLAGEKRGSH